MRTTKIAILVLFCWLIFPSQDLLSTKSKKRTSVKTYISTYKNYAIAEMKRTGIPASITLGQGILESAAGNSYLARRGNNHFGIKCHSSWRGKRLTAKDDRANDCFRSYKSAYRSYIDHSNFLVKNNRYRRCFKKGSTNYKGWAVELRKAGYATDKNYSRSLIATIERFKLNKYDKLVKGKNKKATTTKSKKTAPKKATSKKTTSKKKSIKHKIDKSKVKTIDYNGMKAIVFDKEMSLSCIQENYEVTLEKLMDYNNFEKGQVVPANTYVFLQPLKGQNTGIHRHKVKSKETMESISQLYDVKLRSLYRRNKMQWGTQPAANEYIYLSGNAKTTPRLKAEKLASKPRPQAEPLTLPLPATKKAAPVKKSKAPQKAVASPKKTTAAKSKKDNHMVRKDETLYSIAHLYNIDLSELIKLNKVERNVIKAGQSLIIKR